MNRFVPNPVGMAQLARALPLAEALGDIAQAIAEAAKNYAPVDEGDYRDGIEATWGVDGEATGRVNAKDWKSGFIEFGTGAPAPTPAYAPLRRAAEVKGHRVVGR